ncbi:MAG: acyl-phosphate glycerol 3-phosphate acyltransferase [Candidatus Cloacimonadota bacterium]|nr:MAG: acyl-phosphate glycerol 3-phosphate acyltransferase [Candidatus Cloacimonadota bacterium]
MTYIIISILVGYVLCGIPFGFILGKFKGIDIRKHGSGNVGATNALRILGWKSGLIAMLFDAAKGFVAVRGGQIFCGLESTDPILILFAFSAISGHIFSVFMKFKGGKGVAVSLGVFIALTPVSVGIAFLSFIIIVAVTKYVSLGSVSAAAILFLSELIQNIISGFKTKEYLIFTAIAALFIIIKHKSNIKRLADGNENKISFKKTGKKPA